MIPVPCIFVFAILLAIVLLPIGIIGNLLLRAVTLDVPVERLLSGHIKHYVTVAMNRGGCVVIGLRTRVVIDILKTIHADRTVSIAVYHWRAGDSNWRFSRSAGFRFGLRWIEGCRHVPVWRLPTFKKRGFGESIECNGSLETLLDVVRGLIEADEEEHGKNCWCIWPERWSWSPEGIFVEDSLPRSS